MKKVFAFMALLMISFIPLILAGCGNKYSDISIEMNSSYEIVLGETENDSITVEAKVNGAKDDRGKLLAFSPDNDKLVKISHELKSGTNYITLKALAPGKVTIEARTLEGGVTKTFTVNIVQPIQGFEVKNSTFTVIKGNSWTFNAEEHLDLRPTTTTQKDFLLSFAPNTNVDGLSIEGSTLTVAEDVRLDNVVLMVQSASNANIAPKQIKLELLEDFVETSKEQQETSSKFNDGSILLFEKNDSMNPSVKAEELNVISNVIGYNEVSLIVRVYSHREVDVNYISNEKLHVKKISSTQNLTSSGDLEYTEFEFSIRFIDGIVSGTQTPLNFLCEYVGLGVYEQFGPVKVNYDLAPKNLIINEQESGDLSYTIYNFYSTAKRGQRLQFSVLPSSVSAAKSKMTLLNRSDFVDAFESLQFFRANGEEFFEGDEISSNEVLYCRAKSGTESGSFQLVCQTLYADPKTNDPLTRVLTFNVLSGMTGMAFVDNQDINLQLNGSQNNVDISFVCTPANIDVTKIFIQESEGFATTDIISRSHTKESVNLSFNLKAQKTGTYELKVYSANGFEISKKINITNALENVVFSTDSANSNSAIGVRRIVGGNLEYVALSIGSSVSLYKDMYPQDGKFTAQYFYFESEQYPEYPLATYEYPSAINRDTTGILDYGQMVSYGKLVAQKEGFACIKAVHTPIIIEGNETVEGDPIVKYFVVEGYYPVKTIFMSTNYETLYSLSTVGAYREDLTKTSISITVLPENATYKDNLQWHYDRTGEYFTFDEETMQITAIKRSASTISIAAILNEFSRTYTQTFSLNIVDAVMVSDIEVVDVGDEIYRENLGTGGLEIPLIATAFPRNAFNTKLVYDFIDKSGNLSKAITVSEEGVIKVPEGVGAQGYIRIASEDSFQFNFVTQTYEPTTSSGKNNIVYIPITIANGLSKETAIRIETREEFEKIETNKHYIVYNDIDISGLHFANFTGGLYGRDEIEGALEVSLLNSSNTLFTTISENAIIEGLIFETDINAVTPIGVIAQTNNGTINNVEFKGNWTGKEVSAVLVNNAEMTNLVSSVSFDAETVAGFAIENNGTISEAAFMGSIRAGVKGAGIAVKNNGEITDSEVLLVEGSNILISGTDVASANIAGVVVENAGDILKTYIHSYSSAPAFKDEDKLQAGGFVYSNSGNIEQCFSSLNQGESVVGFVNTNQSSGIIYNCYSNTNFVTQNQGNIGHSYSVLQDDVLSLSESCYSGDAVTSKTVADWLATDWSISCEYLARTIWKIYLDTQNPFLNNVQAEVEPDNLIVMANDPKSTNDYIKVSDTALVLYYYESLVSPLSIEEKAKLNLKNTYSVFSLFTLDVSPLEASNSPDFFNYEIYVEEGETASPYIKISGLNIIVSGLGKQTIKISSKLNPELYSLVDIYTTLPLINFNIYKSSSSLDPSNALSSGSVINLKRTYTQALYSKIDSSIVLVDREIAIKVDNLKIRYYDSEPQALGLYLLKYDTLDLNPSDEINESFIKEFNCSLDLEEVSPYDEFNDVRAPIGDMMTRMLEVHVYGGAEDISANITNLQMEPIDSVAFNVSLLTDNPNLSTLVGDKYVLNEGAEPIKYEIRNSNNIVFTDYFNVKTTTELNGVDENGFAKYITAFTLTLKNPSTQIAGDYTIRIYPNEEVTQYTIGALIVPLKLLPQSIQRLDYSHYHGSSYVEDSTAYLRINPQPSNSLAPGQLGLLELNLFPAYSQIDRVEIISVENEGYKVSMQLQERAAQDDMTKYKLINQSIDYTRIENGISISYSMIENGALYVKTQVPSNIPREMSFDIIVRVYRSSDDQNPIEQTISLAAKFIPSATVSIEGEDTYVVMGRGTTKNIDIVVVGEGDVEVSISGNSAQDATKIYSRAYIGTLELLNTESLGAQNRYTYVCPLYIGSVFKGSNNGQVIVTVSVVRMINGVREKRTTSMIIRVVDFVVRSVKLARTENDTYNAKVGVRTSLEFTYDIDQPQAFTTDTKDIEAVKELNGKIEEFKTARYFKTTEIAGAEYKKKLFIYNGDNYSTILPGQEASEESPSKFSQNRFIEFIEDFDNTNYKNFVIKGLRTGKTRLRFEFEVFSGENSVYSINYSFDVNITNYSTEDKPLTIASSEDFYDIFNQAEAYDYILVDDIELTNFSILNNTDLIKSFDGNNNKIIIKSLDLEKEESMLKVALFDTISKDTTFKNLIIDAQYGKIEYSNPDQFSEISIAGFAINNQGIITNCHVVSSKKSSSLREGGLMLSSEISQKAKVKMAGLALTNTGAITNSRVGDTVVARISESGVQSSEELHKFVLFGQDQIAGFVLENNGIISSSYAKNIQIVNNSTFLEDNISSGFVQVNFAGAKIMASFVEGVESYIDDDVYVLGEGIESSGLVAGFVYSNNALIQDCYSNIKLYKETSVNDTAGTRSSGFAFINEAEGEIVSSLSFSKILEENVSQTYFIGVDDKNEHQNKGLVRYSYYYSPNGRVENTPNGAQLLTSFNLASEFYGYSFTVLGSQDGMWQMGARGPKLVSANNIALSKRYVVSLDDDTYSLPYVANYEYGSVDNPILIRSAEEFNEVFANSKEDSIRAFYNANAHTAFGSYRIINDIDLSQAIVDSAATTQLTTSKVALVKKYDIYGNVVGSGTLDGNSMTLSNLDISISDTTQKHYGLFASVEGGAVIKNLNLTVKEVSASSVPYVGALAGLVDDSRIINVTAQTIHGQDYAVVQGRNIVGGVLGAVSGTSQLNNIESTISAYSTYVDSTAAQDVYVHQIAQPKIINENLPQNINVSYAGSIAGAVYTEDLENQNNKNLANVVLSQVDKIKAHGKFSVNAKVAGGLLGYVGQTTYIHDAWLAIDEGQKISAYEYGVAGGIVGYSKGRLSHLRAEHNDVHDYSDTAENQQVDIETAIADYYNGKTQTRNTYTDMFKNEYVGQTIGGLVGICNGGEIEDSYTKLDVVSDNAAILGGLVGVSRTRELRVSRVYTTSNVQSASGVKTDEQKDVKYNLASTKLGGLFGVLMSACKLDTVIAANYLEKDYLKNDEVNPAYDQFYSFASFVTIVPYDMNHTYVIDRLGKNQTAQFETSIINDTNFRTMFGLEGKPSSQNKILNARVVVPNVIDGMLSVFPYLSNASFANDVFKVDKYQFDSSFWARNPDETLPHLTFGVEQSIFVIDDEETASDLWKIVEHPNKTFYIKGKIEFNLDPDGIGKALERIRGEVNFTGNLIGMNKELFDQLYKDESDYKEAELVHFPELFTQSTGATFDNFKMTAPQGLSEGSTQERSYGCIVASAKDTEFRKITIDGNDGYNNPTPITALANQATDATGGVVGKVEGKSSFTGIEIENLKLTGKVGSFGLIAGQVSSSITFDNCSVSQSNVTLSNVSGNINVGGMIGRATTALNVVGAKMSDNTLTASGPSLVEVKMGGVIGEASTLTLSQLDLKSTDITSTIRGATVYAGGIVGKSSELNVDTSANNATIGLIKVESATTAYVGGMAGNASNLSTSSPLTFTKIDVSATNAYVGGIVGSTNGKFGYEDYKSDEDNKIKIEGNITVTTTGTGNCATVGGVVGYAGCESITINNINVLVPINASCSGTSKLGGIVGQIGDNPASGKSNPTGIISGIEVGGDIVINGVTTSSQVYVGGLVGKNYSAVNISVNLSYGRIQLQPDVEPSELIAVTTLYAGGLVGDNTGATGTISDNVSLSSLEIRRWANSHNVNAIVGAGAKKGSDNHYTYQLSLAVETDTKFAPNHATYQSLKDNSPVDWGKYATEDTKGTVLNPTKITSLSGITPEDEEDINTIKYFQLESNITDTEGKPSLNNFVLLGNGNSIKNTHINSVGSQTIISGITVYNEKFDYMTTDLKGTIDKSKYTSEQGFVGTNNGFLVGVVVKNNYYYNESGDVAGFATINNGTILYSSYNGQVYQANGSGKVAGFTTSNSGIIEYCHVTGTVQGSATNAYSFAPNDDDGHIANCYTIAINEVNPDEKPSVMYDFGTQTDNKPSYYISANDHYDNNNAKDYWKVPNSIECNYGYMTLSKGPFWDISHLTIITTDDNKTTEKSDDDIHTIINRRMFNEIKAMDPVTDDNVISGKFALANNISGVDNVDGTYSGTFNGNNKKINFVDINVDIASGAGDVCRGLFNTITGGTINNLIVSGNVSVTSCEKDGHENLFVGALAGKISNATIADIRIIGIEINATSCEQWELKDRGNTHNTYAGGIAGYINDSTIFGDHLVERTTITSSAKNLAYAGGAYGYTKALYTKDSCETKISVSDSYVNALNTFEWFEDVGYATARWTGFYSQTKNHIAYASGLVGYSDVELPANITLVSKNNSQTAKVKKLSSEVYKKGEFNYTYAFLPKSAYASDARGTGQGNWLEFSRYTDTKNKYYNDYYCYTYSAGYLTSENFAVESSELKYNKNSFYLATPDHDHKNNDDDPCVKLLCRAGNEYSKYITFKENWIKKYGRFNINRANDIEIEVLKDDSDYIYYDCVSGDGQQVLYILKDGSKIKYYNNGVREELYHSVTSYGPNGASSTMHWESVISDNVQKGEWNNNRSESSLGVNEIWSYTHYYKGNLLDRRHDKGDYLEDWGTKYTQADVPDVLFSGTREIYLSDEMIHCIQTEAAGSII